MTSIAEPGRLYLPLSDIVTMQDALGILEKVDAGELTNEERKRRAGDQRRLPGGWTVYYQHLRRDDGTHIATTHVLVNAVGEIVHRHCKEILIGRIRFFAEATDDQA